VFGSSHYSSDGLSSWTTWIVNMEAESPSEISIAVYRSVRRHKPGELNIYKKHWEIAFGGTREVCGTNKVRVFVVCCPQQCPARLGSLSCDCVPGRQASRQQCLTGTDSVELFTSWKPQNLYTLFEPSPNQISHVCHFYSTVKLLPSEIWCPLRDNTASFQSPVIFLVTTGRTHFD
jgi:hypothetical protein